jgi:hypothetical protein
MARNFWITSDRAHAGCRPVRRGTSLLEFIGCLIAVAVGAVAGSLYLGVDLKSYGMSALKSAGVVELAVEPAVSASDASASTPTTAIPTAPPVEVTKSPEVAAALEAPVAAPEADIDEPAPPAAAPSKVRELLSLPGNKLTDQQRRELTDAYWTELVQCMQDEVAHRTAGIEEGGNLQLFEFLSCRSEGHAIAAKHIAQLSTRGVDPHVTAYAAKAQRWHEEGAKLYGRALDLLTDAPTAQLSGPFVQSWQSAATQHRMEETLLQEKHAAVQVYLNHSTSEAAPIPGA